jgi:hypothetical protein
MGKVAVHPSAVPPAPAVMSILSRFDRTSLEGFITVAIELANAMDGDPDLEDATDAEDDFALSPQAMTYTDGPGCEVADQDAGAWIEWQAMNGHERKRGQNFTSGHEDAEDDNEDCGHDEGEPDMRSYRGQGAGCPISDIDKAIDDDPCDEPYQDIEEDQLADDVPMLPVLSADHNVFTDARVPLGISNLQSSYRTNGIDVLSADTGSVHRRGGITTGTREKPGAPV